MKEAKNLTAFQQVLYDFIKAEIENEKYYVCLKEDYSSSVDGYIDGYVIFGGTKIRCSFNERNFVCWHVDDFIKSVLYLMTDKETTHICKIAFGIAKSDVAKNKKLIEDYKKRIESLKGVANYETKEDE